MKNLHPIAQAILGGIAAAIATAIPLVDDGTKPSEILSIALAGLVGSGLTALKPNRSEVVEAEDDPAYL